jgi:rubrerythrin
MVKKMTRGKQQVMFNYLPGKVFDFDKANEFAKVSFIRGEPNVELNLDMILKTIQNHVSAWDEDMRPVLNNTLTRKQNQFVLIEPRSVVSEMFPLVLWCQNPSCLRVFDYSRSDVRLPKNCPACGEGKLIQFRWVKVHRCGAIKPLSPPYCSRCKSSYHFSFDTRGSQKLRDFIWICRKCGISRGVNAGKCPECNWKSNIEGVSKPENMDIDVIRATKTYYSHHIVQLNIIKRDLSGLINTKEWPQLAALVYLGASEVKGKTLSELTFSNNNTPRKESTTLSLEEIEELKKKGYGESAISGYLKMRADLNSSQESISRQNSPSSLVKKLVEKTGLEIDLWEKAGQEMLESVIPMEKATLKEIPSKNPTLLRMGLRDVTLLDDFPILQATFGFTRVDYSPNRAILNSFPPDYEHHGKFPIFVDTIQADAIFVRLDPRKVLDWLRANGVKPQIPKGSDKELSEISYFVKLFDEEIFTINFKSDKPEARLVFGLLHSLSHILVKQATLLCGLEQTGLSEYLLPRTLTIGIYSNHRFGATIGALTSLFEQALNNWLDQVLSSKRCVYDPVCADSGANCHACTHLSETSCKFFNLNLSRAFLFGGKDSELGYIRTGFIEKVLT